jgi:hypothetical protein
MWVMWLFVKKKKRKCYFHAKIGFGALVHWTRFNRDTYPILVTYSHLNGSSAPVHFLHASILYFGTNIWKTSMIFHFPFWYVVRKYKKQVSPKKNCLLTYRHFFFNPTLPNFINFFLSPSLSQRNWEISSYHPLCSHYSLYLMTIWSECMFILLTIFSVSVYFRDLEDWTHALIEEWDFLGKEITTGPNAQMAFSVSLCPPCLGRLVL